MAANVSGFPPPRREASSAGFLGFLSRQPTCRKHPPRMDVGVPFIGNVLALARHRLWVMEQAATVRGGMCELPVYGRHTIVVVSSPDLVHEVLVTRADHLVKGTSYRFLRPVIGDGLLTSEHDHHRRQRKLMAPAFAHRRIAAYADTMAAYTERAQRRWAHEREVDIASEMMRLTLAIASKTLLDADVEGDAASVGAAVSLLMRDANARISTPLSFLLPSASRGRAARDAMSTLDDIILRIIRERRDSGVESDDLLSMLLTAQEVGSGRTMSDRQLRDECMTIFLAGHETTANALSWSLYLLGRHPEAYERLRAEADSVLGGRPPRADDLPRLGFALQVFKEALRLYPPAYVMTRTVERDVEIGGHRIARGTEVIVNIYGMHRRPEYFPDPDAFRPERFDPDAEKEIPRGAYVPFGAGARICIGNNFALMEGQLVLAALAQTVELSPVGPEAVQAEPLVTLRPARAIRMRVRRRSQDARA